MRRLAVIALALCGVLGGVATGAPAPLLTDPAGDHPIGAGDLLSASFSSIRTGAGTLQIDLVVAAAPSQLTPYSYAVTFQTLTCNFKAVYYSQPAGPLGFESSGVGCDDGKSSELPTGDVTVSGTTITYRIPLAKSGLRRGDLLTKIRASTTLSGLVTAAEPTPHVQDTATTEKTYRI
ncbi:MAG TPA: hypothetical protein VNA14_02385 [Mycobacteriales bacterium]|nr:hypothetical protein [Mycobacteriales bacterium]